MAKNNPTKSNSKKKKASKKKTTKAKDNSKKVAVTKKEPTTKDLLLKKFKIWEPEKLFTVAPDEAYLKNFAAPSFFPDKTEKEISTIKDLLSANFDLEEIKAAAEKAAAEKAAAEKAAAE
ncbi:MAG: hypothetical protein JRI88_00665, partial [Deltaproteobacteria bacterium]|nr:hypothetical protein [Deltaproteobacteria bacterium]